jgi:hypothetical protein
MSTFWPYNLGDRPDLPREVAGQLVDVQPFQVPETPSTSAWPPSLPSRPAVHLD